MASHEYLAKFPRLVGPSVRIVEKVNLVTVPTLRNFPRQLEVTVQYSTVPRQRYSNPLDSGYA